MVKRLDTDDRYQQVFTTHAQEKRQQLGMTLREAASKHATPEFYQKVLKLDPKAK